jgi:hypothetical protein
MGCHTRFRVPVLEGKETIIAEAKKNLTEATYYSVPEREMYRDAIDKELLDPVCDLACLENGWDNDGGGWVLYENIVTVSLRHYNEIHGRDFKSIWELPAPQQAEIETYSDEPRIAGFPDTVVKSYAELLDYMKTGMVGFDGKVYRFYYDVARYDIFMPKIKAFFEKHPKGIITFG